MKKYYWLVTFLLWYYQGRAVAITWDGGGDGVSWNDNLNWVGNVVPGIADDVLLDNSQVLGTYSVMLPGAAITVTINTLIISPSGANTITVVLPTGNTNDPGLSVTGPGDALVLNPGAILKNSSGASTGTGVSITNTFRINNGGKYIHHTARGNAAIVSQLSNAPGTETGEFEYDVPTSGYGISVSNRTYGTLTLRALQNGGIVTYTGTGSADLHVNGSLNINNGVTWSLSMSGDIFIDGNLNLSPSTTLNLQASANNDTLRIAGNLLIEGTITESGTGLPVLELTGSTVQNITGSGSITNSIAFRMNCAPGGSAVLNSNLSLPYKLTLSSGNIVSSTASMLTLVNNIILNGGSSQSFVVGPLAKLGNADFIFPIGTGGIYAPLGIFNSSGESVTDVFVAEYIRANPQSTWGNSYPAEIDHVSYVEYWKLYSNTGNAVFKNVSLDVHAASFCKDDLSSNPVNTFVARNNFAPPGGTWTKIASSELQTGTSPPYTLGTITTTNPLNSFDSLFPLTIATDLSFAINPLPIELVSFFVKKKINTVSINWILAVYCSKEAKFEVQRSVDGSDFQTIGIMAGSETSRFYETNDSLLKGLSYYRLRMIDYDGKVSFSRVVTIDNTGGTFFFTSISPNPVRQQAEIVIRSSKQTSAMFAVYELSGRVVKKWQANISEGNNYIQKDLGDLPNGVYHLLISFIESKTVTKFVIGK